MAVTVLDIQSNFNTYIGDSSEDRISATERLQFITEATIWLQEETGNDHMIATFVLPYMDGVHRYKVTGSIVTLLEGADLRRSEKDQREPFRHTNSRELAEVIGRHSNESAWAIERHDGDSYLVVNHISKFGSTRISSLESLTGDGGTWVTGGVHQAGNNLEVDTVEFLEGSGSLEFDITDYDGNDNVSQVSTPSAYTLAGNWAYDSGTFALYLSSSSTANVTSPAFPALTVNRKYSLTFNINDALDTTVASGSLIVKIGTQTIGTVTAAGPSSQSIDFFADNAATILTFHSASGDFVGTISSLGLSAETYSVATVLNSGLSKKDLSDFEDVGTFLFRLYLPTTIFVVPDAPIGLNFYWGSSLNDYYLNFTQVGAGGSALVAGWNQIEIDWEPASTVGSPDPTNITFIRFDVVYEIFD